STPAAEQAPERLEGVVAMLGTLDADDDAPAPEPARADDEPEVPEPVVDVATSADPVRMYLRQMASVALLTREGEVEIAKRIEEGERDLVAAALGVPYALDHVVALADRLRTGELRLRDLVRTDDADEDGEPADDDDTQRRKFLAQVARIRRLRVELAAVAVRQPRRPAPRPKAAAARRRLAAARKDLATRRGRIEARLVAALCGLGLNRRQIDQLVGNLERAAERATQLGRRLRTIEADCRVSLADVQ